MDVFDVSVQDILNENNYDNKENDAELSELKTIIKDGTKRTRKPILKLDTAKLLGDRGLPLLHKEFQGFKFKGDGHEEEDLGDIMRKYEIWTTQLIDNIGYDECIEKIEELGRKREVRSKMLLYREKGYFHFDSEVIDEDKLEYPQETFDDDDDFNPMDMGDILGEPNNMNISAEMIPDIFSQVIENETPEERKARIENNRLQALKNLALKKQKRFDDYANDMDMEHFAYQSNTEEMFTEVITDISSQSITVDTPEDVTVRIEGNRKKALEKLALKEQRKGRKSFLEMAMSQVEEN